MAWKLKPREYLELDKSRNSSDEDDVIKDRRPHGHNHLLKQFNHLQTKDRNSLCWDEFFGSSLDLAPTLLTIYDNIAAANGSTDSSSVDQPDSRSNSLPAAQTVRHSAVTRTDSDPKLSSQKSKMETAKHVEDDKVDGDVGKKRPLSISSSSSASSSSLSRPQHKRPNLADYEHLLTSKHIDHSCAKGEDVNGNNSVVDYHFENMDCTETDTAETNHRTDQSTKTPDKLQCSHHAPVSVSFTPSPKVSPVSEQNFDHELMTSSPISSPVESNPPLSKVTLDTGQRKQRSTSESEIARHSSFPRTKSPPSNLGLKIPTGPVKTKSTPSSPKSPVIGSKDTGSLESSKGSLYVSYVQRVVAEIIETERTYVKSLEDIIKGYLEYLEHLTSSLVKEEDIKCLFSNIRDIYDFGRLFLWELEQCEGDPVSVAECFVRNNKGFVIYTDYCTNYPSAVEVLTRYMLDLQLSEMFKMRQLDLGHGLPLGAYLLRPVQRILKYHLLLQNILKFYDKERPGHETLTKAFKHMTEMAHHINEMKRKHEHAVRIQEIQSQLEDYGGEDLTRLGELVLEGPFRVYGAKASRQVFLFEREILISKKKEGGMLGCKASIQLANLMLVEVIPNEPLSFHIIPFDNPRAQYTLQARNMEQKRRWCQEIKRLILETYKGKIPDKVKSLVMELGRNHDDDYVNSENLDPRRSHHTAPEYLEKRRGRRKSGGRIPDLLKPQKGKRGSSGNRRDVSPRTSPLFERQLVQPSFSSGSQGETTQDLSKSQQSVNDLSSEGTVSRATTHSDISTVTDELHGSGTISKSEESLAESKQGPTDPSNAESVRRAKSFRQATRMRPINSDDLTCKELSDDSESDSDMEDPNLTRDGLREYNDMVFDSRNSLDNLSDDEKSRKSKKQSRYSSMPILHVVQPQSPNVKGEPKIPKKNGRTSDLLRDSTGINSWRKQKQGGTSINRWNNGIKQDQGKSIPAFHDTFAKRSRENLVARALRHPVYTVKHLSVDCDNLAKKNGAKLTNWGSSEKLTKGSLNDLSHLSEDPWVKKTDSKLSGSVSAQNISSQTQRLKRNSECSEGKSASRENLDWMVYVNRNSLNETENQKYLSKYCAPATTESLTPPRSPVSKQDKNSPNIVRRNNNSPSNTPRPVSTYDSVPEMTKVPASSSVPSIVVSSTSPKLAFHDRLVRHHYNRSNSTPVLKHKKHVISEKHRPGSFDFEAMHDSEKIVAEMEDYMKKSENSNSPTCKFPTNLSSFNYDEAGKSNRHSTISTSSYESHSSSSSEGIFDTVKHKLHNWTSKISKKVDDSDAQSAVSSISDQRPMSVVTSDEEKAEDTNKNSSTETLNSPQVLRKTAEKVKKHQQQMLDEDEELRTFLRERGLGGGTIGSRMAHSLPPNIEPLVSDKLRPHSACVLRDSESLSSYELSSKETTPEPQSRFSLPIMPENRALSPIPLNKIDTQQSDSGFSMQSDATDSNSVDHNTSTGTESSAQGMDLDEVDAAESTPAATNTELKKSSVTRQRTRSESSSESVDSFYERRLSMALDSEVFRDSAVFCEMDSEPKTAIERETPKRPRKSIKDFVQILEEKNKPKQPHTVEVKRREPGSIIREKLQTLQQASQYSRHSSRNTSEERELHPPKSVRDIQHSLMHVSDSRSGHYKWFPGSSNIGSINSSSNASLSSNCSGSYSSGVSGPHFAVVGGGNQFMHYHTRAESEHGRESSPEVGCLRSARSLGRLDQLSNEIENLVIMRGWVRSLINKFQNE